MGILEIISTFFFLIFLIFELKQHIACWLIGIISSTIYIYTQWESHFYGMMILAIFLVFSNVWGWYQWGKDRGGRNAHYGTKFEYITYGTVFIFIFTLSYFLLIYFNSKSPILEGLIFTLNIVGTFLMAKKSMLAWIVFFISNILCIPMYMQSADYIYAGLYMIYSIAAVVGFVSWRNLIMTN